MSTALTPQNQGQGLTTATREKALKLLGTGVSVEQTASAIGVTPARISQLLAEDEFAAQVSELKYKNLLSHSERDTRLDTLEDKLIDKIEHLMPLIMRPMEAIKALQTVNGAKRRGSQGLAGATANQTVVQIALPTMITQKFVTNVQNQVIQAGDQQLLTIQSGTLLKNIQAENPETVGAIQQANSATHSFTSEVQNDAGNLQRIRSLAEAADAARGVASPNNSETLGRQQAEGRITPPLHFIPVGS